MSLKFYIYRICHMEHVGLFRAQEVACGDDRYFEIIYKTALPPSLRIVCGHQTSPSEMGLGSPSFAASSSPISNASTQSDRALFNQLLFSLCSHRRSRSTACCSRVKILWAFVHIFSQTRTCAPHAVQYGNCVSTASRLEKLNSSNDLKDILELRKCTRHRSDRTLCPRCAHLKGEYVTEI